MSAHRIRRGILKFGASQQTNVHDFEWQDDYEYNRDKVDLELSGEPVLMGRKGRGSFKSNSLLSGLASGYLQAAIMVIVTDEVDVSSTGAETVTNTTITFNEVTLTVGGDVDPESPGSLSIDFEYGYIGTADPDA